MTVIKNFDHDILFYQHAVAEIVKYKVTLTICLAIQTPQDYAINCTRALCFPEDDSLVPRF